jgi:3'-phosphoadenosine 5'-phosphosulfate sulfotransferase (PAPS reductase)/FAD synthetase
MFYTEILNKLREKTDKVILFHSATGKDSICLCDLLSKQFNDVLCVFMYLVKGLEYENRYIAYAEKKYSNIKFIQVPHYALNSFIKVGYLGIKKDEKIYQNKISLIDKKVREKYGYDWSIYGFKKNDGVTRRLMLNTLKDGIHYNTKKAYPLMDLKNENVLMYISDNNLIEPFNYSKTKPSSGCDISQPEFLSYIKKKYPNDLNKIFNQFPMCEAILFRYENKTE